MRSGTRSGFTLIELLAVVAIILLLLSLLVPLLGRVVDAGRRVVCANRVRQVMTSCVGFASDNDGVVPGPNWLSGDRYEAGWLSSTNYWPNSTALHGGQLWPYVADERVYRCPVDPVPATNSLSRWPNDVRMVTSYVMNGSLCRYGNNSYDWSRHRWQTERLSEFRPSDIFFWECDETSSSAGYWWDGSNFPSEGLSARHMKVGMVGCIGGHAEALTVAEYYALERSPRPNRLWNNR